MNGNTQKHHRDNKRLPSARHRISK